MIRAILFVLLSLLTTGSYGQQTCCNGANDSTTSWKKLGQSYQSLAKQNCCSHFDSQQMQLMDIIARRAAREQISLRRLKRNLGAPNYTSLPSPYSSIYKPKAGEVVWVYCWRGLHDFVYFVASPKGKVREAYWFFAYE